jgi:AAA domain/TrwC relaxase
MAVVVTAASGYDLGYVWKGQGQVAPEKSAGGYYMNAALSGEAEGRWFGPGAEALGLVTGQVVVRGPYDAVYRQIDPRSGVKLGRARGNYVTHEAHLARLTSAEPHATAERLLELEREAHRLTREPAPYTDVTVSFSKSISVLHASIRENARRARQAGDEAAEAYWDGRELAFQEVLQAANRVALEHAQRWAGVTRTGYHGSKVNGQETGRFEQARVIVSSWLQGTSRDGDPQDHVHNQFARLVQTVSDGKWRALDTVSLRAQLPAMQAVAAAHVECGLTREFGVEWVARADSAGNEIRGVTQAQMDAYSSRTETIREATPAAVASWTARYGRAPSQRELLHIQQVVTLASRPRKDDAEIDWDACAARWDATLGGQLASVAPAVSSLRGPGTVQPAPDSHGAHPSPEVLARAARTALAVVQAKQSTWTKADLLKQIGLALPAETRPVDPQAAVTLLHELADRAVAGEFEQVASLEAPAWPPVPACLRRDLDGRSVYTRPGTQRYATRVQMSLEEQVLAQARREGAPRLDREVAAQHLGADADALDAQLMTRALEARASSEVTGSGLRMDQGAALHYVLTSPRVAEILVGPAGSGKTRVLAEAARAWTGSGTGAVLGLATAQAARNVLASAGVELAENSSVFLGHAPGRRGARGIRELPPGTLIVIDEASMMSVQDLADIIGHAASRGCKVIVAGDQEQLTAVEGGGAMMLLARHLGHVQLAEAVRFTAEWEQQASLRLRAGDLSALDAYDINGRIRGGEPDQIMDEARKVYVAHHLAGTDVELIAWERERCREMSRRIRDDLLHLGQVERGREVTLANGAKASVGDLIICRKNDHDLEAGEAGRTLANGDVLRIDAIGDDRSVTVRRAIDRDAATGKRCWTEQAFLYRGYRTADLGYAVTGHAAQGRTVTVGIPLVTGGESRQWLYSAMTRGALANIAHVFIQPAKLPDPEPGTRPAPELARHERLRRERDGLPAEPTEPTHRPDPREPMAVMADVLERDGSQMSALETQRQNLVNADHLAILNAQWQEETARLHADRYRQVIRAALPAGYEPEKLDSPQATWLWRTMHAAEAAGLDVAAVADRAISGRSLTGARDVASVVDARIRCEAGPMVPRAPVPWSEQVPAAGDPDRQRYLAELARAMDERKARIGEFAAEHAPAWAVHALGPVPDEPLARLDWEQRASHVGAYRELYGWSHDAEPVGPEPAGDSPEKRATWHAAFSAMNRAGNSSMLGLPDGSLWHMRDTYRAETQWAPPHVGAELRQVRIAAQDQAVAAMRADAEAGVARKQGEHERAGRHELLARSARAAEQFYRQREGIDAGLMEDRQEWARVTEGSRHLAVAADSELRRRHPGQFLAPLRSAEPEPPQDELPAVPTDCAEMARWITRTAEQQAAFRARIEERQGVMVPSKDPDYEPEGEAWPSWPTRDREAVLQPPKPDLRPSPRVIERAADREADR